MHTNRCRNGRQLSKLLSIECALSSREIFHYTPQIAKRCRAWAVAAVLRRYNVTRLHSSRNRSDSSRSSSSSSRAHHPRLPHFRGGVGGGGITACLHRSVAYKLPCWLTRCHKRSRLVQACPNHWHLQGSATLCGILQKDVWISGIRRAAVMPGASIPNWYVQHLCLLHNIVHNDMVTAKMMKIPYCHQYLPYYHQYLIS